MATNIKLKAASRTLSLKEVYQGGEDEGLQPVPQGPLA